MMWPASGSSRWNTVRMRSYRISPGAPPSASEGGGVAAQQGLHVLAHDETGPQHPAVAEHEREQPDDPLHARFVGEHHPEEGEVDLGLPARRRLEPHLVASRGGGPDLTQEVFDPGIAAGVALFA